MEEMYFCNTVFADNSNHKSNFFNHFHFLSENIVIFRSAVAAAAF